MCGVVKCCSKIVAPIVRSLDILAPLVDFIIRLWIARYFFFAGIDKIQNWSDTVQLFHCGYAVPFLSPTLAAGIGSGADILLSVLLFLGLGGRVSILIFFLYNAIVASSIPHLWTPEGAGGLALHVGWGMLLAMLMVHGPGKLSIDHLIAKWHKRNSDRLEGERMRRFTDLSGNGK